MKAPDDEEKKGATVDDDKHSAMLLMVMALVTIEVAYRSTGAQDKQKHHTATIR